MNTGHWSDEEFDVLDRLYPELGVECYPALPGRSVSQIFRMAKKRHRKIKPAALGERKHLLALGWGTTIKRKVIVVPMKPNLTPMERLAICKPWA